LGAGVTMEVTAVKVADGKLVAERPILQDSAIVDVGYVGEPGIIIGRLNAFDVNEPGSGAAEVVAVEVEPSDLSAKATIVSRGAAAVQRGGLARTGDRPRGGADRGRGRRRRTRPGRPRLRGAADAAARGRAGAGREPRRGAGGGDREGQGLRGASFVRGQHAA